MMVPLLSVCYIAYLLYIPLYRTSDQSNPELSVMKAYI